MYLSYFTLFIALSISLVAAWYSIIGLTAIFAAAAIPIMVMGGILEVAKVTITVWLHEYWHRCRWLMKLYLVPAVVVLMLITSMGIFGFLSKAHLDQAVPTGDVAAQVSLLDEKIKTQRDNIDTARAALRQMDAQVDQVLGRTTDDKGAERAVQIRRQQATERGRLQREIAAGQAEIAKLNEQRAPIAAELRKVEAEVGPIKYVASLIYGDDPDANLLERAVRWMIILLVIVFDPLAIMMVLAATESLKWERQTRAGPAPNVEPETPAVVDPEPDFTAVNHELQVLAPDIPDPKPITESEPARFQDPGEHPRDRHEHELPEVEPVTEPPAVTEPAPEAPLLEQYPYLSQGFKNFRNLPPVVYQDEEDPEDTASSTQLKAAIKAWKADNPNDTIKNQRHLLAKGAIDELPWIPYLERAMPASGFGPEFPAQANKGDTWVRTDSLPNRVFKFNGQTWIAVDKSQNDSYTYDTAYIDHLIERLGSGEYDPELLSDQEREQVATRLSQRSE